MIDLILDRASNTGEELKYCINQLPGNGWVNWTGRVVGEQVKPCLNALSRSNKLAQLTRLELCGVRVVPFALRPGTGEWFGRLAHHQQGRDLTRPPKEPEFYTQRLLLDSEWRIHVFKQNCGKVKVLRSGLKVPRVDNPHPWIRSHRLGWKISYVGGASEEVKQLARASLDALQLDFGAVDIGVDVAGQAHVLEVNTCPGLEGGTLDMYVEEVGKRLREP